MRTAPARSLVLLACALAPLLGCSSGSAGHPEPATPSSKLVAKFAYEVDKQFINGTNCPATAIRLQDYSSGKPTRWRWTFPDGSVSHEQHPVKTPALGIGETVTLTVHRGARSDSTTERINYAMC